MSKITWACGVTCVPSRSGELLPATLESLARGGFDGLRLFMDGVDHDEAKWYAGHFGLPVTARNPRVRTHANWMLALGELYARRPNADYFALFQDDLVMCRNVRPYLERTAPALGYYNLFTLPTNQARCPRGPDGAWAPGWFMSNQLGKGAVALAFPRGAVVELLSSRHMYDRARDELLGWKSVDGAVVTALTKAGRPEFCHHPSLVEHRGRLSTMGNRHYPPSESWPGPGFDALSLLPGGNDG